MLSPQLRRKVHELWSLFWSSGLSNPLVAIEQITYLLFIRELENLDRERVKQGKTSIYAKRREDPVGSDFKKCRWSYITESPTVDVPLLRDVVFPWLRTLEDRVGPAQNGNTLLGRISGRLSDAYFVLDPNKTETLRKAISLINGLLRDVETRSVNSDIMGDVFEYLLEEVKESGKNGQFRTPRHVIRFMVQLLAPELGKTVLDPACGSGGFLLNTLLQWKADRTDENVLRLEWDGTPHNTEKCSWPRGKKPDFNTIFRGYDNDRTMVRIAWMNLLLHDIESPEIHQLDALSKRLGDDESGTYHYILANPPFTGSVDEGDLSENRKRFPRTGRGAVPLTTKSELLFAWLMLDLLEIGGRAAVIVPDGVLFGSTNAHRELRRQLLFENTLEAVVSLPANMFQPYSGVKTSIVIFQKLRTDEGSISPGDDPNTREVWFYEINDEAYSLDQRRKPLHGQDNDLWDALVKFRAWSDYRTGEEKRGKNLATRRAESIGTGYHQPVYWEERWCTVDDGFLKVFPEKSGDKGHTFPLHELWRTEFNSFDPANARGARQYDDAILARVRPAFEKETRLLVQKTVTHAYAEARQPDAAKALTAAEKNAKALGNALHKLAREGALLDREFDQFGLKALKAILKEITAKVPDWAAGVAIPTKKPRNKSAFKVPPRPLPELYAPSLVPQLKELAKLDGYNVWCRSGDIRPVPGKLITDEDGVRERRETLLSWIAPVRKWAERETWGDDPETKQPIVKPTHNDGIVDPAYLIWLRDSLEVFGDDASVKKEHLDRLEPDCIEAKNFDLSASCHKPFVFDPGQHRPPSELITELQAIHGEVQERLGKLLKVVTNAA